MYKKVVKFKKEIYLEALLSNRAVFFKIPLENSRNIGYNIVK